MNQMSRALRAPLISIPSCPWLVEVITIGGAWWCQIAVLASASELPWLAVTGASMFSGFAALGRLQSTRPGIIAPQAKFLLGGLGMLIGLALDGRGPGLATLASQCSSGVLANFLSALHLHWTWLPAMHAGMIIGGITAIPFLRISRQCRRRQFFARVVQDLVCSAWMIAGMTFGALVFRWIYQHIAGFFINGYGATGMLGGMFAGMVWGMVVGVAAYRLYFRWRPKLVSLRN